MRRNDDCLTVCLSIITGIKYHDCFYAYADDNTHLNWKEKLIKWGVENNYVISLDCFPMVSILDTITIAVGVSPRNDEALHAILFDSNLEEMVHDPHEDNTGIIGLPEYYINVRKEQN